MKYIYIRDTSTNTNVWQIYAETGTDYLIRSRKTHARIHKDRCYKKPASSLLWTEEIIDIKKVGPQEEHLHRKCTRCLYAVCCPDYLKIYGCNFYDSTSNY